MCQYYSVAFDERVRRSLPISSFHGSDSEPRRKKSVSPESLFFGSAGVFFKFSTGVFFSQVQMLSVHRGVKCKSKIHSFRDK